MGENTIVIIFLIVFILVIFLALIYNIIKLTKSSNYNKTKAKVIDYLEVGSSEWGKYFKEEYEKTKDINSKVRTAQKYIDTFQRIKDSIPISISNSDDEERDRYRRRHYSEDDNEVAMIAEYTVNNKKYYYQENFSSDLEKKLKSGDEFDLKYEIDNPKNAIRVSSSIKSIIILIFVEIFLIGILYIIMKSS